MSNIKRIYIEKRSEYRDEANSLMDHINTDLHLNINELRIINRYDISNINDDILSIGIETILKEPMVDEAYLENLDTSGYKVFAIEYLPGQYDQRSDSCKQCFMIIDPSIEIEVKYAKVYLIKDINDKQVIDIQNYLINPVDQRLASLDKPITLVDNLNEVKHIEIIDRFIDFSNEELVDYLSANGMAMSLMILKLFKITL